LLLVLYSGAVPYDPDWGQLALEFQCECVVLWWDKVCKSKNEYGPSLGVSFHIPQENT
jgi:hypothetical protein